MPVMSAFRGVFIWSVQSRSRLKGGFSQDRSPCSLTHQVSARAVFRDCLPQDRNHAIEVSFAATGSQLRQAQFDLGRRRSFTGGYLNFPVVGRKKSFLFGSQFFNELFSRPEADEGDLNIV